MTGTNKSFLLNTLAALLYNGLAGFLIVTNPTNTYYYTAALFLIAGLHMVFLFLSALLKIRKFKSVGNTGFSILSVFFIHIIFWLLFVNLP